MLAMPPCICTASAVVFLPLRPTHMPNVSIRLNRHWDFGWPRSWAYASIDLVSPVTGEKLALTQSLTATTLRGARRQRGLDLGSAP